MAQLNIFHYLKIPFILPFRLPNGKWKGRCACGANHVSGISSDIYDWFENHYMIEHMKLPTR